MKKRSPLLMLIAGLSVASSFSLSSCSDTTYGQDQEPAGPLQITRLTMLDSDSRDVPVFTDTSAPLDCSDPSVMNTDVCQLDPFKDRFSLKMSPPTPFSDEQIRVVFNKIPTQWNGMDLEKVTKEPDQPPTGFMLASDSIVSMTCSDSNCGTPPLLKTAQQSGASQSPDPTTIAYGPALQIVADTGTDPVAALEPESNYVVSVDPGVSGRDGNKVNLDAKAMSLLKFNTEPFKVLATDIGDGAGNRWVYSDPTAGTAAKPYTVEDLASNGVVAVQLNAPVDDSVLKATTATAMVGNAAVPAMVGINMLTKDPMTMKLMCQAGDQRTIYIFPQGGSWGNTAGTITLTLKGADVRDLSQLSGHPAGMGRHSLKNDVVITAKMTGKPADMMYPGLTADAVRATADCPTTMEGSDAGTGADGGSPDGGAPVDGMSQG